jgi:hypothetical protein
MDFLEPGKQLAFLWRLVTATQDKKITWSTRDEVSVSQYAFKVRVGRFGYTIASVDKDDLPPYQLEVFRFASDEEGAPVEPVTSWTSLDVPITFDPMQNLYQEAKRQTLGADDLLDEMFADLAKIDGGPSEPTDVPGHS